MSTKRKTAAERAAELAKADAGFDPMAPAPRPARAPRARTVEPRERLDSSVSVSRSLLNRLRQAATTASAAEGRRVSAAEIIERALDRLDAGDIS